MNKSDAYREMLRIRMVEEEIAKRYGARGDDQPMRCPIHLSIGQEAVAVGVCAALGPDDMIVSTHRCHAHYLAKGGNLKAMIAELHGKSTGCCGGRGGSMHLFDKAAGVMHSGPIVGSAVPLAVGMAMAIKRSESNRVVACFLGDGAMEEGVVYESMRFATLYDLPILFVIENNGYSCYTPINDRQANELDLVVSSLGDYCIEGDGNDVENTVKVTEEVLEMMERGHHSGAIILDTYRTHEHCGPGFDERPKKEQWVYRQKDPLKDCEVDGKGIMTEINEAFQFAEDSA